MIFLINIISKPPCVYSFEIYTCSNYNNKKVLVCMCTTSNFCQATFIPQLANAWPNATETKHHSHHNYAVSIQLAQARPHNTLYLD